ncbi:MAG: hypothetical protein P1V35_01130 [Planctomycetota bacterium]|nr:hypothetical protein [Planctomycetota bacterium]
MIAGEFCGGFQPGSPQLLHCDHPGHIFRFMAQWNAEQLHSIEETLVFIKLAHKGQSYGDVPYWNHPKAVADALIDPTLDEYLAALLHDVIEDTTYTEADLRELYANPVVDIVCLLSKEPGVASYQEAIQRIIDSKNRSAMKVKMADNYVNISGDKSKMTEARRERLIAQYSMSLGMLASGLN